MRWPRCASGRDLARAAWQDVDGASALPDAARRWRLGRHRRDDCAGPRLASFRCPQVILANELVEPASIRWVAGELQRDPQFDFYCLVDSVPEVRLLEGTLDGMLQRGLPVLLELGLAGGRTGCRTRSEAREVAQAVAASRHLSLAGVEGFEGIIGGPDLGADLVKVDGFLSEIRALAIELDAAGLFAQVPEVIVTAGGSRSSTGSSPTSPRHGG